MTQVISKNMTLSIELMFMCHKNDRFNWLKVSE